MKFIKECSYTTYQLLLGRVQRPKENLTHVGRDDIRRDTGDRRSSRGLRIETEELSHSGLRIETEKLSRSGLRMNRDRGVESLKRPEKEPRGTGWGLDTRTSEGVPSMDPVHILKRVNIR